MGYNHYMTRDEITERLECLPKGSISRKTVNGKVYFYHRWYEDGKRKEKYIPEHDVANLTKAIQERKNLIKILKSFHDNDDFISDVILGDELKAFSAPVANLKKRDAFNAIWNYIHGATDSRVLILYGLRRTGKTTLIRQTINEMSAEELGTTAFIQIMKSTTLSDLNKDLKSLSSQGYRYIFIDEVTLLADFIEGSAFLSDIFAAEGMKIVLSGTDSLSFLFAEDEQLYNRTIRIHTTFIPYREFSRVLGINGIDEYIRFGGTMSVSGNGYNPIFTTVKETDEYVDAAIARNIQHSLKNYQDGRHFRLLQELYEKAELTNAINRVVEDMNHRFTLDVLTRSFRSNDLALSRRNLRNDRSNPTDILDNIDIKAVTERLKALLEIREKEEMSVTLTEEHAAEIREYLELLDLVKEIPILNTAFPEKKMMRTVITQPGLRYSQADALVESLMEDPEMLSIPIAARNYIEERIRNEIKGRMTEDMILLETSLSAPEKKVFTLQFAIGEFDMVIADKKTATCDIFEIKHSDKAIPEQARHLMDEEKCSRTELMFGTIKSRNILYRGSETYLKDIHYMNIEEYLLGL